MAMNVSNSTHHNGTISIINILCSVKSINTFVQSNLHLPKLTQKISKANSNLLIVQKNLYYVGEWMYKLEFCKKIS